MPFVVVTSVSDTSVTGVASTGASILLVHGDIVVAAEKQGSMWRVELPLAGALLSQSRLTAISAEDTTMLSSEGLPISSHSSAN